MTIHVHFFLLLRSGDIDKTNIFSGELQQEVFEQVVSTRVCELTRRRYGATSFIHHPRALPENQSLIHAQAEERGGDAVAVV